MKPDLIANIRFLTPEEGGAKRMSITMKEFSCPFEFEGSHFDCRLLLDDIGVIELGSQVEGVPIKFLTTLLSGKLKIGSKFTLWERGTFAEGTVVKLFWNNEDDK